MDQKAHEDFVSALALFDQAIAPLTNAQRILEPIIKDEITLVDNSDYDREDTSAVRDAVLELKNIPDSLGVILGVLNKNKEAIEHYSKVRRKGAE